MNPSKQKISIHSDSHPYASDDLPQKIQNPRRLSTYFIVLVESGTITYTLDLKEITVTDGQLLFAMPNQVFIPPISIDNLKYYKVLFDENILALMPQSFPFLVNPLNNQCIDLDTTQRYRVKLLFEILNQILYKDHQSIDSEIVLAYLHALLVESNSTYFKGNDITKVLNPNLSKFIEFKLMVESHLKDQPSIQDMAEKLSLSTNGLYRIVKEFSGVSPKIFFTNRLMIEARRKLSYSSLSVKELAYELGFNDPDYFSRVFKKCTGKSVTELLEEKQDLSGK